MNVLFLLLYLLALSATGQAQSLERGKEINATCVGCHGEFGQGGKRGKYPHIAGQRLGHLMGSTPIALRSRWMHLCEESARMMKTVSSVC